MSACIHHPDREAAGPCSGCGKSFCEGCLISFEKLSLCEGCKARYLVGIEEHSGAPAESPRPLPNALASGRPLRRASALHGTPLQFVGGGVALLFALAFVVVIVASLAKPWSSWRKDRRLEQATDRLVTIGAALERYRGDRGRYPVTLEELVPKYLPTLPIDPFAQPSAPPRYDPTGGDAGPRLWSVGPDGKDDQGEEPADIVYTIDPGD